eukprot:7239779-Alexandrium_andersonii.AAC.1
MKTARVPAASGAPLRGSDVAVSVHGLAAAQSSDLGPSLAHEPTLFDGCAVALLRGLNDCPSRLLLESIQ